MELEELRALPPETLVRPAFANMPPITAKRVLEVAESFPDEDGKRTMASLWVEHSDYLAGDTPDIDFEALSKEASELFTALLIKHHVIDTDRKLSPKGSWAFWSIRDPSGEVHIGGRQNAYLNNIMLHKSQEMLDKVRRGS